MQSSPRTEVNTLSRLVLVPALLLLACSQMIPDGDEDPNSAALESQALVSTGEWSMTGSMNKRRTGHTATLLPDGRVLVTGGWGNTDAETADADGGTVGDPVHASAELYDPATGQWSLTGSLTRGRRGHTATLLRNGHVLVVGGRDDTGEPLKTSETYDPATGTWVESTARMNEARYQHTATLLPDGKVLVFGGASSTEYLASVELYDPVENKWGAQSSSGTPPLPRRRHTATLLPNGKVLIVGGRNADGALRSTHAYDPVGNKWVAGDLLAQASFCHTATLLPDGKVLVVGGQYISAGTVESLFRVELYDGTKGSPGTAMDHERTQHTATLLPSGKVLIAGGMDIDKSSEYPFLHAKMLKGDTWQATGPVNTPRVFHTATLLADGKVLITGGEFQSSVFNSAELYDPNAGQWTPDLAPQDRLQHTATVLPDGKVLVAGGRDSTGTLPSDAQAYDPETHGWTASGSLVQARYAHTATLLPSGKVLVAGGQNSTGTLDGTEEYGPGASTPEPWTWTVSGPLAQARYAHTATLLPGGKVLVVGGQDSTGSPLLSAEEYDPGTRQWTTSGSLAQARYAHTATLLPGGKVLVVGGKDSTGSPLLSAEEYDPSTRQWTTLGSLAQARYGHTATLLPNGKVLVAGGQASSSDAIGEPLTSAEIYNPERRQWESTSPLNAARFQHTATLLFSGKVLVAGGQGSGTSAEVYDPDQRRWSVTGSLTTARAKHQATLLTNGQVLITGGGSASVELYEETGADTGEIREWRPKLTGAEIKEDKLEITGSDLCGRWEASGGTTQNSATNVPLVSLMSVEGGALTRLKIEDWICDTTSDKKLILQMPDVPGGHYILSVMTNAIHGGQMALLKGSNLAAPKVTAPAAFVKDKHPIIEGTAEKGRRVTVWLNGIMEGTTQTNNDGAWSFTPTNPLVDKIYEVYATATDAVGNISPHSEVLRFEVDTRVPEAPVIRNPKKSVNQVLPSIDGTAEAGSRVTVWLDDSVFNLKADDKKTWSVTLTTPLTEGNHKIYATATDAAGNNTQSPEHIFEVDLTSPPAPTVTEPNNNATTDSQPVISGKADPNSTVTVFLDGNPEGTTMATTTGDWFLKPTKKLTSVVYKVSATATDEAGNISPHSADHSFNVDAEAPKAPVVTEPKPKAFIKDEFVIISGTADKNSTVTVTVVTVKGPGTDVSESVPTNDAGGWEFRPSTRLEEGVYIVRAIATDAVGNKSEHSEGDTFEIDRTPPNVPEVEKPEAIVKTRLPVIRGTADPKIKVTVRLNGGEGTSITSNENGDWSYTPTHELAADDYTVSATAKDEAGNISPRSAERSFTIQRSHYGWSCSTAPAFPASWALLTLGLALRRRRFRSP